LKAIRDFGQLTSWSADPWFSLLQPHYPVSSNFSLISLLVACTRLYKLLCRSVGPSVRQSVRRSLLARSTRLLAIGLVFFKFRFQSFYFISISSVALYPLLQYPIFLINVGLTVSAFQFLYNMSYFPFLSLTKSVVQS